MDPTEERCGYDLVGAVVGAEGTTGIVTRAMLKLMREPENHRTLLATFADADTATRAVSMIIASGIVPAALEMMDQLIIQAVEEAFHVGLPLDAGAVLIIELEGLEAGLTTYADEVMKTVNAAGATSVRLALDEAERALLWKARKRAFGAVGRLAPNYATQDGVVPRTCLPRILRVIATSAAAMNCASATFSTPVMEICIRSCSTTSVNPIRSAAQSTRAAKFSRHASRWAAASPASTESASRRSAKCR